MRPNVLPALAGLLLLTVSIPLSTRAQDSEQLPVSDPQCTYFGAAREAHMQTALREARAGAAGAGRLSALTGQVAGMLAYLPNAVRPRANDAASQTGTIDSYIFADLQTNGVQPAPKTTDWEFIRRVTLDLTGRIPLPDRVLSFVADQSPDKRAKLVDELLNSPQWVDKWTMYYGDVFKNTVTRPSSGTTRFASGRNAFYQWIHDSLASGRPYNKIASDLIAATGTNSYQQGALNLLVGSMVNNGPVQDTFDQQTADMAETFLGLSHVNCVLCHNGRGHLDALSLWGKGAMRNQMWQLSSFLSHTQTARVVVDPSNANIYYWSVQDNTRGYTNDYTLNTTSGNRPPRVAPAGCTSGKPCYYMPPAYLDGSTPKPGESYRMALARMVTGDFLFARAAVNYIWAQFFGRGIVDPPNTLDPARLDPDNPPPDPWTLQPSNARLLNALAQGFIDSNYNLKWLMRTIANSDTYQLSSRYNGDWNVAWEPLFARKFVRRLWAEEIHDAVAQSSGAMPTYNIAGFSDAGFGPVTWAMQLPDTVGVPSGVSDFLDSFLRGNRDDQPRKPEGSVLQALNLMNDSFIESRLGVNVLIGNVNQTLLSLLFKTDEELVNGLFLNVLSRYPSDTEKSQALAVLKSRNRNSAAQDLAWSLYNKVDFIFNY